MIVALAAAVVTAPVLSPPIDRPMRLISETVRTSKVTMRFLAEHRVVFRRVAGALTVEVTLLRLDVDGPDEVPQNYRLMLGPMLGRTLRFHLSDDGRVTGMEDQQAAWDAFVGGRRAMIPARDAASPLAARRPESTLEGVPAEGRAPLLAEALLPLLAPADRLLVPGQRPATIAAPLPGGAPLGGTRRVGRDDVGRIVVDTDVATADGANTLQRHRVVDPATGLAAEWRETTVRRLGQATLTTVKTTTLR